MDHVAIWLATPGHPGGPPKKEQNRLPERSTGQSERPCAMGSHFASKTSHISPYYMKEKQSAGWRWSHRLFCSLVRWLAGCAFMGDMSRQSERLPRDGRVGADLASADIRAFSRTPSQLPQSICQERQGKPQQSTPHCINSVPGARPNNSLIWDELDILV